LVYIIPGKVEQTKESNCFKEIDKRERQKWFTERNGYRSQWVLYCQWSGILSAGSAKVNR